ncbi:MAG TPA: phytoene desaturase family protein [Acidimicrobiales bacterium]|jgi:phytoene desaturase|nr:phytoene desaturase family protein [Acidimicrobiales bacterium]
MRVVVVGAGLGGLSAACHLAGRGHEVVVIERADVPGGRAGLVEEGGYRFDTGPSVLTMTGLLSDVFRAAGADMADHLTLSPVDPMYRAVFADGSAIRVRHGREAMTEEIRRECGDKDAGEFGRFCDWLGRLYRLELPNFIDRSFDSPLDLAWPLRPIVDLVRMGGFRKLNSVVESYFSDDRLVRLFSFQSMYAGLSPFEALAVYCVITYMDTVEGVYFPAGGMHAIPRALAAAAEKAGATFVYGRSVERVVRRAGTSGPVTGVRLDTGEVITADAVVLNPDLAVAYRTMLPELQMPRTLRKGNYSPSCVVWLAGVKGGWPPGAAHHNIHFGAAWKGAFQALLKDGTRMPDPSILVSGPSSSDPSLAPEGCSSLYVLEPMPNLDGRIDWVYERERVKEDLTARVAALGYPSEVEVERFFDPTDWERRGMERGTPFALSHRFFQSGPFRPNNVTKAVPGLVFVGSGTVPGVGVPMVLLSGRLAADRVEEQLGR